MTDNDKPNAPGLAHKRQAPKVTICRDVYGGTLTLRARAQTYLPQFEKETSGGYSTRLSSAVLFNAFKRAVGGLVGMVFRKDPVLDDDVPTEIRGGKDGVGGHAENIDLAGRALPIFVRDCARNALIDGHTHIFVDMQTVDAGQVRTLADERNAKLRPYWINLLKMDVLRFRTINVGGRPVLVEFVYRTRTPEADGKYGEKEVERIRIYRLVRGLVVYEVWKRTTAQDGRDDWAVETPVTTMTGIDTIPLVTMYAERSGLMESDPPLLDLALENILHYQVRSDRCNTLHIAGVPIPVIIGMDPDDAKNLGVGSDLGFQLPIGGDAKYLEPTGSSLDQTRQELGDIEKRMATLGIAMLQRDTRAAETAEARRIEASESQASLSSFADGAEDAIEEALGLHARWLSQDDGGSCTVNRDFERQMLDPAMVKELRETWLARGLSLETFWDRMVAGEILPEGFDPDVERERIAEDDAALLTARGAGEDDPDAA